MTVIRPNSISGINSITGQGGDISIFRADGTAADVTVNNITSGVVTATTFKGAIDATTGTFSGNLGVGGVLTYEDVTNIDSVGVITARGGIKIGATGANTLIGGNATGIGIGIAAPTSKLYVNGVSTNDIITARAADTNGTSVINILAEGTTGHSRIKFSDTAGTDGQISYTHTDRALTFAAGGTTEKVRIPSTGGIELKTDGRGIQFPIPQTPHNANTARTGISSEMRYYETGTMTPGLSSTVLNSLQNPVFTDASYARRVCRYVRVGHLVHVTVEILMASSVTYATGASDSTAPVCITGVTPFRYAYNERYDVSGQPDYYPCSISYSSSNLTNDTLYAVLRRDFPAEARIEITKPGSGGSRQFNSTNYGEVFPANGHIIVSCTYAIDTGNADY